VPTVVPRFPVEALNQAMAYLDQNGYAVIQGIDSLDPFLPKCDFGRLRYDCGGCRLGFGRSRILLFLSGFLSGYLGVANKIEIEKGIDLAWSFLRDWDSLKALLSESIATIRRSYPPHIFSTVKFIMRSRHGVLHVCPIRFVEESSPLTMRTI